MQDATIDVVINVFPFFGTIGRAGQFATGQVIRRMIQTSKGPLALTATVEVLGDTVKLKGLSFMHPDGMIVTNPRVGELKAIVDALKGELTQAGFSQVRYTALRIGGANSPRVIDKTISLK